MNLASHKLPEVLVVDDDPVLRIAAIASLSRAAFEMTDAASGAEALARIGRQPPDLVLLDVDLPELDGFQVCERIRCSSGGAELPVVMMTGRDDVASVERAYRQGATDFVSKPVNWASLAHRIRSILRASENLAALRYQRSRLDEAQELARLGSFELDLATGRLSCSAAFRNILGLDALPRVLYAESLLERVHRADRDALERLHAEALEKGSGYTHDYRIVQPDGSERIVHTQSRVRFRPDGKPFQLEGFTQDITERRRAEAQIRFLAFHDSLTGLGNRASFQQRLRNSIDLARRHARTLAVLYLDLDHFKRINDTLGHTPGDALLCGVADRLVESVRSADCVARASENDGAMVSRLGGDEFSILLDGISDAQDAARVARRVNSALPRPMLIEGREIGISASIGIAIWPQDGADPETLLRNADSAMYHAKERGRNSFQFYRQSLNAHALERLELEGRLRRAIDADELLVHYQPKWELGTRRITGCEALVRWRDPERGFVEPSEFIPVAEETGLISGLGENVLRRACQQLRTWHESGHPELTCAVNFSPRQIKDENLPDLIGSVLRETALTPRALEFEITETALVHSGDRASQQLQALHAMGVRITLDDFGTGYSSLASLRRFPVSGVKIDRSFVNGIGRDPSNTGIAATVASMGKTLGLRIIAEGVETEEQRRFLLEQGCHEAQGFLVSPALPPEEFVALLRSQPQG